MTTISGVCSRCRKVADVLHEWPFGHRPKFCDECNEVMGRAFLSVLNDKISKDEVKRQQHFEHYGLPDPKV